MDFDDIRRLAELMRETQLTVLELSEEEVSIRMERAAVQAAPAHAACPPEPEAPAAEDENCYTVTAPMVGVFYAAPSPGRKPYLSIGDKVRAGDVVCIIEAMKMMNEITAEADGVVTEICVGNKQVVDYGHPLFRMRREAQEPPDGQKCCVQHQEGK